MHLAIKHVTEYHYSEAAWDSFNELHLRPADDYRQTLLAFDLRVSPHSDVRNQRDYHGNVIQHFHLSNRHTALRVEARSRVVTYPIPMPCPVSAEVLPGLRHRFFSYLAPSERVPLDRDWFTIFGALRLSSQGELVAFLLELTLYLKQRFHYDANSTNVNTPLAEFANHGHGVCQDFAHAMLALCRMADIPARYISGYIHSNPYGQETMIGAEASHAWVEVFLPGNGWVGFDPTNGCMVNEAHVKVADGRDYSDIAPIKGLHRGGGSSKLYVEVAVRSSNETRYVNNDSNDNNA